MIRNASITKFAQGISALLGIRDSGAIPGELSGLLAPTVDMRDLFLLNTREFFITNSVAAPAVGANFFATDFVVPAGELWFVWSFHITMTTGGAVTVDACPGVILDGCPTLAPMVPYQAAAASQQCKNGTLTPFWASAGSRFGVLVRSVTGAPDIYGAAVFTRLKI